MPPRGRLQGSLPGAAAVLLLCFILAAITSVAEGQTYIRVDLRVLILTTTAAAPDLFIRPVLEGYGVAYDVVAVDAQAAPLDMRALVVKPDGSGKYSGIFIYPALVSRGLLTQAQMSLLEAYQIGAAARMAHFGVMPQDYGFLAAPGLNPCTDADQDMFITPEMPLGVSGVKVAAMLNAKGITRCPGALNPMVLTGLAPTTNSSCIRWQGASAPCTAVPVINFKSAPQLKYDLPLMAAAMVTYNDTRKVLISTLECARWSQSCLVIGHLVASYLLHDIIPGQRQALLTVHMDDVFLATDLVQDLMPRYRLGVPELQQHIGWQNTMTANLPPGSEFRLEFAFNGNGVLDAYADPVALQLPVVNWIWKGWKKPPGTGVSLVPANYTSALWDLNNIVAGNPVAAYILRDAAARDAFFWSSHTFSHQDLDNATISDVAAQFDLNINMAAVLGLTKSSRLSTKVVVTPAVTGLANGDALAAINGRGYKAAVGDNSYTFLQARNPYHMLRSTVNSSNYDGFLVIPRYSTEIYYDTASITGQVARYNAMYAKVFNGSSTWDQILQREADRVLVNQLLTLRADPHMMHQANMAMMDAGGSLVMQWVKAITDRYNQLVNWPVQSLMLDSIYDAFVAREQRDACQLNYSIVVDRTAQTALSLNISSAGGTGPCSAPLLLPEAAGVTGPGVTKGPPAAAGTQALLLPLAANGGNIQLALSNTRW